MRAVEAIAPGKVILFGEHAINRGQPAIAAAVGAYSRCQVRLSSEFEFVSADRRHACTKGDILRLCAQVDGWREKEVLEPIRGLAREEYFAPQKYILGKAWGGKLPEGLRLEWTSEIPSCSGLGSGAAAFTSMILAVDALLKIGASLEQRADWARHGDVVAHGGVASGLDTQTSLLGGYIFFSGQGLAERVRAGAGSALVIAHCGIGAATREVNTRVRLWLAERPRGRMKYFDTIGLLSQRARAALETGDWQEVGRLMVLNQCVLEKIGVSCPEIDRLIEKALDAGALGAKVSGSGGGGIMVALCRSGEEQSVAESLRSAAQSVIIPDTGVAGASVRLKPEHPQPVPIH